MLRSRPALAAAPPVAHPVRRGGAAMVVRVGSGDGGAWGGGDGDACGKRQIREQVATSCRSQTLHRRVHKPGMSYTYTCMLFIPTCSSSPQPSPKPDPNPCPNPNPNANHTYFHEMNVRVLYLSFRREEPGLRHQPLVEVWKSAQRNRT